jgi:molecular chaperone DnaK (HSP70)
MTTPVGIDLGTTNSAVAQVDDSGQVAILPNAEGHSITPSVISFLPDRIVIGDEAKDLQAAGVGDVAAFFKRQMGDTSFLFEAQGRDWSASDLSALLLRHLKEDAEQTLAATIGQAVITVPAYFRNPQREATRSAGEQAGIEVLQLINEPTAAAIAYGVRQGVKDSGKTLLVYDLGGGTFDLTLLRIDEKEIRVLNSEGDHELGGKDWDDRIVQFLATRFEEEFGADPFADALSLTSLLAQAEQAKRQLTNTQSASLAITHDGRRARYSISRADFEGLTADLVERTISLTNKVLADAEMSPKQLDGTVLVGGSTRMPMVHDFIRRNFGRDPLGGVNVDEAVALGAALLAAQSQQRSPVFSIGGRRTVDVTNHSLGMVAENPDRSAYVNSIILPKNKAIPSKEQRPYQFQMGGDGRLEIFMTQGESEQPGQVTYLGLYAVDTTAVGHKGRQAVIDIEYAYDSSGTVQVAASLRGGGSLPVGVEPLPDDVPTRFLSPPPALPQPVHITVYLAFDLSGSMSGDPLDEAKKAAHGFVDNLDLGHASVGIVVVADQVKTVLKACQNGRKIAKAIDSLEIGMVGYGNGEHPFDEAKSLMGRIKDPTYLVVLADGIWYDQDEAIKQAKRCHKTDIDIIAIGFGSADQSFLQAIASSDEAGILTDIGGLVDTFSTIAQVLTEGAGARFSLKGRK